MIFNPVVPLAKKIETIKAKDIATGSSVYLNEDGSYVEYIVRNQGIPSSSSLYDSSCNGTWLQRKDIHSNRIWSNQNNNYSTSSINTWLNDTFFNSLGDIEKSVIKQVKIPYSTGGKSTSDSTKSGSNGLSCKIFLASAYELTNEDTTGYLSKDGAIWDYTYPTATLDGVASAWWLRSPYWNSANNISTILYNLAATGYDSERGIRPALILPFNAEFDKTNMRLVGVGNAQISDQAEGSTIKINENGSPVEFVVAKHDYESELNGAGRTLVVRKTQMTTFRFNDSKNNDYANSSINTFLNGDYQQYFDDKTQALIGSTKFKYMVGNGDWTVKTLECTAFILSLFELGFTSTNTAVDGSALPIADVLVNNITKATWVRNPSGNTSTIKTFYISSDKALDTAYPTAYNSIFPCFTLPANTKVDSNGLIIT